MNFIFQTYPLHPWFAEWTIEPRGCNSSFRINSADLFFRTQETVGRIVPNTGNPEWALQIPVPQNSKTNILFNGFCAYFEQKKKRVGAEVLSPEAGVLWGRSMGIPAPVIATDNPVEAGDGYQWIEGDTASVLLAIRDDLFCVITKSRLQSDALALAEHYFSQDLGDALRDELERRAGAQELFEEMSHHDSLATICAESIMKTLRPAEGSIPLSWCQSSTASDPQLDVNELYSLALAWKLIDIQIAEELVTCVLRLQTNSGAIPIHYSPHASHSVLEAPKPLIVKIVEMIWNVRRDAALLDTLYPLLRRHLQWLLHHFDPKRRGIHCWKNRNEPLVPEIYESDLSSVDLTVLLLTEIEALNRLRSQSATHGTGPDSFEEERNNLQQNLIEQFWNEKESAFTNAIVRDKVIHLKGLPAFMPLLWDQLPNLYRSAILEQVHESGTLPGGISVLTWRKSALDDNSFPLLQQQLVFQALNTADPNGQLLHDFSRISLQGFMEWHSLSLETNKRLPINPVMAAYIMSVQAQHHFRYQGQGKLTGSLSKWLRKVKADRFDLLVVAATCFAVFSFHLIYDVLKAPPPYTMLEAQMNSAYADKDATQVLENCTKIIKYYPEKSSIAKLYTANISMLQNNPAVAVQLYKEVRAEYPDSPGPMIGLGLALQLQGKFVEADKNYYEFCYIFEEIFPQLVTEISHFRYLMQEGFNSPPKWPEIYRYQLMHEL